MMNGNPKFRAMRVLIISTMFLLFMGCPGTDPIVEDSVPISQVHFTFHQDVEKLYFSSTIAENYEGSSLSQVNVLWFGTDSLRVADSIALNDEGIKGDILSYDGIYGIKIANDSTEITNVISQSDSGLVFYKIVAKYGTEIVSYSDSSELGNLLPAILSISFPDTMVRPTEQNLYHIDSIFVTAHDPNGLSDIQSCFLLFKKPDGSYANNGDPILLYDDGAQYPNDTDNPSIWDLTSGDGVYSRLITIGYDNPLGTYVATFWLKDWSGLFVTVDATLEVIE